MEPQNKARQLVRMIRIVAQKHDIQLTSISHNWILKLSKNKTSKHIFGYNFELNSATAKEIADDKSATADLLNMTNIPVAEYHLFLNPYLHKYIDQQGNWQKILACAEQLGYPLICKTAKGTGGNNVFKINSIVILEDVIHKLFAKYQAICLSPFYAIKNEYRIIVLDGEVMLVYSKQIPHLTGNGKSTILQLLTQYLSDTPLSEDVAQFIAKLELPTNHILPTNKHLPLNWKHNLGKGAKPVLVADNTLKQRLSDLALQAAKAINITFASVDLIETMDGQLRVLEINAGIMTENFVRNLPEQYDTILAIYEKAVLKMLNLEG